MSPVQVRLGFWRFVPSTTRVTTHCESDKFGEQIDAKRPSMVKVRIAPTPVPQGYELSQSPALT